MSAFCFGQEDHWIGELWQIIKAAGFFKLKLSITIYWHYEFLKLFEE